MSPLLIFAGIIVVLIIVSIAVIMSNKSITPSPQPIVLADGSVQTVPVIPASEENLPTHVTTAGDPVVAPAYIPPAVEVVPIGPRSDKRCGPSYGNSPCGGSECCSDMGWCGTKEHCYKNRNLTGFNGPSATLMDAVSTPIVKAIDAVSTPIVKAIDAVLGPRSDKRCGPTYGNAPCGGSECCSDMGWCGTKEHCYKNRNLATFNGPSATIVDPPTPVFGPRSDKRCGPSYGNASCGTSECCSTVGWCGSTQEHCYVSKNLSGFNGPLAVLVDPARTAVDSIMAALRL